MVGMSGDLISQAVEVVLHSLPKVVFKLDEPLKHYTSYKIGGPVRVVFFPDSAADLVQVCGIFSENGITPFIMGNGSNLLASDNKLDLVVVNTSRLDGFSLSDENGSPEQHYEITADAGVLLSKLAVFAFDNGLAGLEFAHGIPGSLGGAVIMNAGAYGGEMKDVIFSTSAYNAKTGVFSLTAADHEFSYRHSRFSDSGDVVLSSVIRLQKGDKESIRQKMDELSARRRESQPLELPSCGSVFKRPKEGFAAAFIEQAGLKGYTVGGAQVSEKHAGFIVNRGDATFMDVMSVIEHVQDVVFKQFDIRLELEVKLVES